MSAEAMGWTYKHSPYVGAVFGVHLALADSANDMHDQEIWARQSVIAAKARVSRSAANTAIATLVSDGFLTLLEDNSKAGRKANRYRLEMPASPVVYPAGPRVASGDTSTTAAPDVSRATTPRVASDDTDPKEIPRFTTLAAARPGGPPAPKAARQRDLVFEAVCEVCGIDWRKDLTSSARGALSKAVKELKGVGATPDEIRTRASRWARTWPTVTMTQSGLGKHWATFASGPALQRTAQDRTQFGTAGFIPESLR